MNNPRDIALGTSAPAAAELHERALWQLVAFYGDPFATLDAMIAADPGWGLAQVTRAVFVLTTTEPALLREAQAALTAAAPLDERRPTSASARTWAPRNWRWPGAGARPAPPGTASCNATRATCWR